MLPLWLAFSASLMLHVAVLVAPGWALPFEDEHAGTTLDATLVVPVAHKEETVQTAPHSLPTPKPARKKRGVPAAPTVPAAPITDAPVAALPAEPAEEQAVAAEETATAPEAPADSAGSAVPPAPSISGGFYTGNWPKNGRIVFQVSRGRDGFIVGQSTHRWSHDGETYHLNTLTETTGLAALFRSVNVEQESRGVLSAAGLQPLEFKSSRSGKIRDSVRFDPEQRSIFTANGERLAFAGMTQDMLSLFYQLGAMPFDAAQFIVKLMTGRKVADYAIVVDAPLDFDSFLGKRKALHLTVKVAGGGQSEDSTEIWLDAETRLPLKIRHRDRKGEVFDQVATAIELDQPQ